MKYSKIERLFLAQAPMSCPRTLNTSAKQLKRESEIVQQVRYMITFMNFAKIIQVQMRRTKSMYHRDKTKTDDDNNAA
jgi:hypothetical protein